MAFYVKHSNKSFISKPIIILFSIKNTFMKYFNLYFLLDILMATGTGVKVDCSIRLPGSYTCHTGFQC
jgi:hypothetical protein